MRPLSPGHETRISTTAASGPPRTAHPSRCHLHATLTKDDPGRLPSPSRVPRAGQDSGLDHLELYVDPLYCVMPRGHPAGRRREINIRDLAEEQWVMDNAWTTYYQLVLEACQAAGFEPRVVANCRSFEVVLSLVRAGCGIAILPGLGLAGAPDLPIRPINPRISRRVYAACRRGAIRRPTAAPRSVNAYGRRKVPGSEPARCGGRQRTVSCPSRCRTRPLPPRGPAPWRGARPRC